MLGLLLSIAAFPTLFLNEGRAVKTARALKEGAASVVAVDANRIASENEGKFIHVSGQANTNETLVDDQFGVTVNAIRLARNVEMYQWKQSKEEVTRRRDDGESTTEIEYSYEKTWSSDHFDSNSFDDAVNHANPTVIPFASTTRHGQGHKSRQIPTAAKTRLQNREI